MKNRILIGNSFSLTLIRHRGVVINPASVAELRMKVAQGAEIISFWGHENTRAAAERVLGFSLKPESPRPALVMSASPLGLPSLGGMVFRECWVLSPDYVSGCRPAIGVEVDESKIVGWRLLKLTWKPEEGRINEC